MKFLVGLFLSQVLSIIFASGAVYMATHGIAKWWVLVVAAIICGVRMSKDDVK